jgi:hypothetical protein
MLCFVYVLHDQRYNIALYFSFFFSHIDIHFSDFDIMFQVVCSAVLEPLRTLLSNKLEPERKFRINRSGKWRSTKNAPVALQTCKYVALGLILLLSPRLLLFPSPAQACAFWTTGTVYEHLISLMARINRLLLFHFLSKKRALEWINCYWFIVLF